MGVEIERKFLVKDDSWKPMAGPGLVCRQGYLLADEDRTVRLRILGEKAFLTLKGATSGISRTEFEYEIPVSDAEAMLVLCGSLVEKTRYLVDYQGMTWELDVFEGDNAGLIMAEIELDAEGQKFSIPNWAGKEVSGDPRYYNACLSKNPFGNWGK